MIVLLGRTPSVVTESILAARMNRMYSNIKKIVIVHTEDHISRYWAEVLSEAIKASGIGVEEVIPVSINTRDITTIEDNMKFIDAFERALYTVADARTRIIVSIAGGRKTMSAIATFFSLSVPGLGLAGGRASSHVDVDIIYHVLVPPDVEYCGACRDIGRAIPSVDKNELVNAIAERLKRVEKDKKLCRENLCSEIENIDSDIERLAACVVPCIPPWRKSVAWLPGRGILSKKDIIMALWLSWCGKAGMLEKIADALGVKWNTVEEKAKLIRDSYGEESKHRAEKTLDLINRMPITLHDLKTIEAKPASHRNVECRPSMGHHAAKFSGKLKVKLDNILNSDAGRYIVDCVIEGVALDKGQRGGVSVSFDDEKCAYYVEAVVQIGGDVGKVIFYITALTEGQAYLVMQERIIPALKKSGLIRKQ